MTQPGPQMTFLVSSRGRGYKNSKATGISGACSEMRPVLDLELAPMGSGPWLCKWDKAGEQFTQLLHSQVGAESCSSPHALSCMV